MFENVIVPIDGSELADAALAPAADLARRMDAALVLLQAVHPDDVDLARTDLSERLEALGAPRGEIVLDPLNGPVGALRDAVSARAGAVVCMTTHGRGGIGRALFGSVAEEALREVGGPFVLVGPSSAPDATVPGPVLVPLDGSHRSESILPLAASWATALGVGMWIVTVGDPSDAAKVRDAGGDMVEEAYVERIAGAMPREVPSVDWEVLHGSDPAAEIVRFAAQRGCSTIALATHGRTGLARVVAGSVASEVVHDHPGLVLVTRTADVGDD
ncbi:universal stress protein [Actinomarinicola tropica]|uniref:UspA domain-containing protein n=1 Tax=Actinomarinicola tropica TaxID=2789776 RepID=A0A5Q2RKJ3_9ACTN|nr:universal stress protein [Actinomarinicola tropica]QGG96353.1 hypothetical protein GH723_15300 [Actinomarinicola tropica]